VVFQIIGLISGLIVIGFALVYGFLSLSRWSKRFSAAIRQAGK
jgi:hypothetical protein